MTTPRPLAGSLLLALALAAGCARTGYRAVPLDGGGGADLATCGLAGQRCCGGNTCKGTGLACANGLCASSTCGGANQPCCTTGQYLCSLPGATCTGGVCVGGTPCGASGQPCCAGDKCTDASTTCMNGTCGTASCGASGQPCCANDTCTDATTTCTNGTCQPSASCGGLGQPCCVGSTCTAANTVCQSGVCAPPAACGALGQPCCPNNSCTASGSVCSGGSCVPCGALGQACCAGSVCTAANTACASGVCASQASCGGLGQPCCIGSTCTAPNTVCTSGVCGPPPQCGGLGQACCTGNVCTGAGTVCSGGQCLPPPMCGASGQPCCTGNVCNPGLACTNNVCGGGGTLGVTGAPCAKNTDCAAGVLSTQKPTCLLTTGTSPNTLAWPMGYCTTPCRATATDPTSGVNSDCPGGNATCGDGDNTCFALCQSSGDCRTGYSCFVVNTVAPLGCEPTALSMCNPTQAGSCPMMNGMAQTCVNVGDGTVGACVPSCNPFANTGCTPTDPNASDCHASDQTGEGLCTNAAPAGTVAGASCGSFYSDCPGGYGCLNGRCWKYCNDGNRTSQCSANATCQKFSANSPVPTSVAGICSMSP